MDICLNSVEARVLGSLIEKDITTPDYYPLSLNALVNACNQRSNREPVMDLNEDSVREALHSLGEKRLAGPASGADTRVPKYEHRVQEVFNFDRREVAMLCVLLLRGPQTPGELRGRTERMFHFEDLDQVQATLQRMMERQPPLVAMLPRQPGMKESRYAHLLSGEVESWRPPATTEAANPVAEQGGSRMAQLEADLAAIRKELAELKQQVGEFRKQFE